MALLLSIYYADGIAKLTGVKLGLLSGMSKFIASVSNKISIDYYERKQLLYEVPGVAIKTKFSMMKNPFLD